MAISYGYILTLSLDDHEVGVGKKDLDQKKKQYNSFREKPTKPKSAFLMWLQDRGQVVVREAYPDPTTPAAVLGKLSAKLWRELDHSVRVQYEVKYEDLRIQRMEDCRKCWKVINQGTEMLDDIDRD